MRSLKGEETTVTMIITQFELDEDVFVPAGDGEPAKWKRRGAMTLRDTERHWGDDDAKWALHDQRMQRPRRNLRRDAAALSVARSAWRGADRARSRRRRDR
jgi:hypothetical protein